jgi:hypothetical protein
LSHVRLILTLFKFFFLLKRTFAIPRHLRESSTDLNSREHIFNIISRAKLERKNGKYTRKKKKIEGPYFLKQGPKPCPGISGPDHASDTPGLMPRAWAQCHTTTIISDGP